MYTARQISGGWHDEDISKKSLPAERFGCEGPCKINLGSFFPRLTDPDRTVRFPSALDSTSAVWLLGAKPPKMVSWQLS